MSAWIVSKRHIDFLVSALAQFGTLDMDAHRAGQRLWAENVASVAYRYQDDTPGVQPERYLHTPYPPASMGLIQTLKAIRCYCYQSCEHPSWEASWSYRAMKDLQDRVERLAPAPLQVLVPSHYDSSHLVRRVYQTAAYDAAPWGIEE